MINFIRRWFKPKCCTEFTQWETHETRIMRIPTAKETLNAMKAGIEIGDYLPEGTERWQERQCVVCGKIQQRDLDH